MRAVLDAGPLSLSSGGLARYVAELIAALTESFPSDEFSLASDRPFPAVRGVSILPGPRHALSRRWWLWGLPQELRRSRAHVFHGTNFAVPYWAPCPTVVTVHDLSPWRNPAWHASSGRVRSRAPRMIRRATLTITPSEAIRREAIERFALAPDRVRAIPHAASSMFRPVPCPPVESYFLFVGTLEPRKNIHGMIEAWRAVRHIPLRIAGRRRADFAPLAPEPNLEILGEVPDSDLPALYSQALAVIYPSHYEGFGLPVLEAMQCGALVVASCDPAITEVAAGAAWRVAGNQELAEALRAIAANPQLAHDWRSRALRRALDFSWSATARRTHDVYKEAIRRFGRS